MKELLLVLVVSDRWGRLHSDRLLSAADSWLLYFLAYKAAFLSRIFYHHSPFPRKTTLFILAYCLRKIPVQAIEIFKRGIGAEET